MRVSLSMTGGSADELRRRGECVLLRILLLLAEMMSMLGAGRVEWSLECMDTGLQGVSSRLSLPLVETCQRGQLTDVRAFITEPRDLACETCCAISEELAVTQMWKVPE